MSDKWGLNRLKANLPRIQSELLDSIGENSVNHFKDGFKQGGKKTNLSKKGWKPRKSKRDAGRAILVKKGDLRDSIHVSGKTKNTVTIISDLIYSKIHNGHDNGSAVTGNAFGTPFKMPVRNYIGHSKELDKDNMEKIGHKIGKEWVKAVR